MNVRVIQPARTPQLPTWTKALICVAGFFMAALSAAGWLVFRFAGDSTYLTAEGLAYATGLPVLAVFPRGYDAVARELEGSAGV